MTTPVATDLSALPTLSSQLNELDEAQLNGFADAAVALIAQATTVPELQELRVLSRRVGIYGVDCFLQ